MYKNQCKDEQKHSTMSTIEMQITIGSASENEKTSEKIELYILLIVIKLAIIIVAKLIKYTAKLYKLHNGRIIDKHTKSTTANVRETVHE